MVGTTFRQTVEENGRETELSQNAEVRFKGVLRIMSVVIGPLLKKKIAAQAQSEFAKLKELCEQKADRDSRQLD